MLQNKKGSLMFDIVTYSAALFTIGIVVIFVYYIWQKFVTEFNATGMLPAEGLEVANNFTSGFLMYDTIMVLLAICLIIVLIVSVNRIRTSAIYFVFILGFAVMGGLLSYFFNFMFIQIIGHTTFDVVRGSFPKVIFICTNLHWFSLLSLVIGSIVAFSKKEQEAPQF